VKFTLIKPIRAKRREELLAAEDWQDELDSNLQTFADVSR
jgi:hypothetical protein